jgi:hypothetical protein
MEVKEFDKTYEKKKSEHYIVRMYKFFKCPYCEEPDVGVPYKDDTCNVGDTLRCHECNRVFIIGERTKGSDEKDKGKKVTC